MSDHGSPVNDVSGPTRTYAATWFGGFGLLTGLLFSVAREGGDPFGDHGVVIVVVFVVGVVSLPAGAIRWVRWLRSADRGLKRDVEHGSREIVSGAIDAVPVAGRALRFREDRRSPAWAASRREPIGTSSLALIVTVLSDPPRRVVAQVPQRPEGYSKGTPLRLLTHPELHDIGVVDDRVGSDELERIGADPRWEAGGLPSDATVMGGYTTLLLVAAGAFVVGAAVSLLLMAIS